MPLFTQVLFCYKYFEYLWFQLLYYLTTTPPTTITSITTDTTTTTSITTDTTIPTILISEGNTEVKPKLTIAFFSYQVLLPAFSTINTHIWLNDLPARCNQSQGI